MKAIQSQMVRLKSETNATVDGYHNGRTKRENQNTWRVDFPNDSRTYVIEFKTSVDEKVIEGSASYDNTASYTNQGSSRDVTGKVSIQHGGESVKKGGEYHKDDPDHVYWHVMINGAQSVLDDVVITDTPSPNQVLDPESLVIYGTNVTEDGTITPDKSVILEEGKRLHTGSYHR